VPDTYPVDDVARLLSVVRAHAASLETYTPSWERLDVDTTLFTVPQEGAPRDMWWGDAVSGELTVVELPGPHHRLLDPPNADDIARHVTDVIGDASSRTSAA
jgi:thioesterase domain-containing protein